MKRLTAEQIAKATNHITNRLSNRRAILKLYRAQDESHLWPICGKFNVTNRAARQVSKFERESGCTIEGLEYCYTIEERMSRIGNNERNW